MEYYDALASRTLFFFSSASLDGEFLDLCMLPVAEACIELCCLLFSPQPIHVDESVTVISAISPEPTLFRIYSLSSGSTLCLVLIWPKVG